MSPYIIARSISHPLFQSIIQIVIVTIIIKVCWPLFHWHPTFAVGWLPDISPEHPSLTYLQMSRRTEYSSQSDICFIVKLKPPVLVSHDTRYFSPCYRCFWRKCHVRILLRTDRQASRQHRNTTRIAFLSCAYPESGAISIPASPEFRSIGRSNTGSFHKYIWTGSSPRRST